MLQNMKGRPFHVGTVRQNYAALLYPAPPARLRNFANESHIATLVRFDKFPVTPVIRPSFDCLTDFADRVRLSVIPHRALNPAPVTAQEN